MKIIRMAASAVLLLALAGCVGQAPAGTPGTPYPATPIPSPTLIAFATTSTCFHPLSSAPQAWLAVICPAADGLVAAQAGLNTLQRAADGGQGEQSIADAAYSSQDLTAVETPLNAAPKWTPGVGIVNDLFSAIATYRSAIDDFRFAYVYPTADWRNQAHRFMTTGNATVTRVVKALVGKVTSSSSADKYNAFLDHSTLGIQVAYSWFDELRVANNLVDDQTALGIAQQMAAWAQTERNWLIQHPTDACYTKMKDVYLDSVITPTDLVGRNYVRWASMWPANDPAMWADLTAAVTSFGVGHATYAAVLKAPTQTCVKS